MIVVVFHPIKLPFSAIQFLMLFILCNVYHHLHTKYNNVQNKVHIGCMFVSCEFSTIGHPLSNEEKYSCSRKRLEPLLGGLKSHV